jgi:hypothetical protein
MSVTKMITMLVRRMDDRLIRITDSILEYPLTGPTSPAILNPLVGLVCARLDAQLQGVQSDDGIPVTAQSYFTLVSAKSSIESLMNHPLIYAYTASIIMLSYYLWKEHYESNQNNSGRPWPQETGGATASPGTGCHACSPTSTTD